MAIAIVDNRMNPLAIEALCAEGFTPLLIPKSERLSPPIASHPDMLLFIHGRTAITEKSFYNYEAREFFARLKSLAPD